MNPIKVSKIELLKKVKQNRETHRQIFLEAVEGYKKRVLDLLEKNLDRARRGERVQLYEFHIVQPMDMTREYDRAIAMLEMSIETEVQLSESDFRQLIQDEWGWKQQFITSNALYSATADAFGKSAGYINEDEND